ncbi:MAG: hypothetical protein F4X77_14270 [Acidobacteriia bacterium]|nr:hypothetical protein [Terriglobia bacterium]MYC67345.1 hypothetical protein [Terriglobia bacterium]
MNIPASSYPVQLEPLNAEFRVLPARGLLRNRGAYRERGGPQADRKTTTGGLDARPVTESKGMLYEQDRVQDVCRSAPRRLRHRVSAGVRASWPYPGLGRDSALQRTDAKHCLVDGPVPAGRAHCVINGAVRLAGSAVLAGRHRWFAATVVGIRGWLGGNRCQTEADP